ncbi:helix-turn-helix domain-containing protein [Dyadobacter sp. CY261]|uniref:helix-turn-helix domain-containing protein n=1 Tax=Dyadobacter sp. CY261 TaxID=2907203 RepID=UPI001F21ECA3|nr:helix-turn-helix domain-containing protein [Dyadobacter sp. CY261]MCF0074753.1 helix-turn-helix domain-containing protein [Dyadobacter sp. CY261]
MNFGKEILFFFSALGAFNGLILGVFLIFFTQKKYLANNFLGALLLASSIRIAKSVCLYFDGKLPKIYLQIGLSACLFIGPFLYYFVRSAVTPMDKMPKSWIWTLIVLAILTLGVGVALPYADYPVLWNKVIARVIYLLWFGFLLASGLRIRGMLRKLFNRSYTMKPAETWISMIFLGNVLIFLLYFSSLINAPFASYISGSIAFSLILYLMITLVIYKKKTDELFLLLPDKPVAKKLNESDAELWLTKLEKVMSEKAVYKNPDLKLHDLSREIQVSGHQLSALLNDRLGKNFTTYINEWRIAEACKMMVTDQHLTLEAIGYEVGFNSKSTFFAAFKKVKGITPSSYQQTTNQPITD